MGKIFDIDENIKSIGCIAKVIIIVCIMLLLLYGLLMVIALVFGFRGYSILDLAYFVFNSKFQQG